MGRVEARGAVRSAEMAVTVTRADGTVQNYGIVGRSQWWWRFSPQRWISEYRIRALNRQANQRK